MSSENVDGREPAQAKAKREAVNTRTHVFEDMSVGQNCDLIMISTNDDLLLAKGVTVGDGSRCWTGHMSDASVQQLSRDRGTWAAAQTDAGQGQSRETTNFTGIGKRYL